MGVLASCISAFVTVNRVGFALEGAWCAFDRIYYDSLYGQLKTTPPRWEGLEKSKNTLGNITTFCGQLSENPFNETDLENPFSILQASCSLKDEREV